MDINQNAPLAARKDILINAPIDKVWTIQTDFVRWPEWQPDISSITLDGPLAVGTVFRWQARGMNITSTIREYEPRQHIGWTGDSLGMRAIHRWLFEAVGSSTRVMTEESLSGWFARLLKLFDAHFLDKSLENSLRLLKARAEQE
jgi:uncharacterized protein YndB with AHSA1/START domain